MYKRIEQEDDELAFLGGCQVASATECTGLIQGMPIDDSESDSYQDLYPIPEQKPLDPKKTGQDYLNKHADGQHKHKNI